MKRALITGITGQDGSYLAELLLSKGYEVHGLIRRASTFNTGRIDHSMSIPMTPGQAISHYGDIANAEQLTHLIYNMQPDEIYHLGAQSHVKVSFEMPEYTCNVTGLGTTECSKPSIEAASKRNFTKLLAAKCLVARPLRTMKRHRFSRVAPMLRQSYMRIGWR